MNFLRGIFVAAGLAAMTVPATAWAFGPFGYDGGWFVELKAGAPLPPTTEIDVNGAGLGTGTYDEGSGYAGAITVGKHFDDRWRGELEVSLTHAEDGNVYLGGTKFPHSGDVDIYGFMANALYQFDDGWLKPFVGAGVGFSVIDVDDLGAVGGAFVVDDTDTVFVVNLIAGVDYPISDMVTLTGRYTVGYSTQGTFDTTAAGIDVDKDAQIHNYLSFGVRIDLN